MSLKTPDPVDRHVGNRVRQRRSQLGVSQERLADSLGVSFQQVQKYEKGVNRIGPSRLQIIANALNVSPGFFFEGAPGQRAAGEISSEPNAMDLFMASHDGLVIANAFVRIPDPALRSAIARFVRDAGRAADASAAADSMARVAGVANALAANGAEPGADEFDQSERNST